MDFPGCSRVLKTLIVYGLMCLPFALSGIETFTNPVAPDGHDPWVVLHNGEYYYCYSHQNKIWVNRSTDLTEAVQFQGRVVWTPEQGKSYSKQLWAPELHQVNGEWYIYVAASDGANERHRMFVLHSELPDGVFKWMGKLATPSDKWAIDGTLLEHDSQLYFIWSGWRANTNDAQHLYIAKMESPTRLTGNRIRISSPELEWELRSGRPRKDGSKMPLINEGPQVLQRNGKTFIIYSASGSWTDHYCLGMLELVGGDPMKSSSWKKHPESVFASTSEVIAPGHASFTTSLDGKEDWIVFHAAKHRGAKWNRQTHMQRFTWDQNGIPEFTEPVSPSVELKMPGIGDK